MDRQTIYFGQVPLETDLLHAQQNAMVALAKLAAGVYGATTIVNGFTCTPTGPASLNVLLTTGEIYQLENLEQTTWSSLPADLTDTILKQGIQLGTVTFGITPPGTVGFSQVFLIEVQYQDLDSGLVTLPYFNSANPASPFMGPGNSGTAQNTVRQGVVASQVKAGIAATTGTQVAPTADAGWTGLFLVTVANGAATITSGNITTVANAPFLPVNGYLPQIPTGVQNQTWTWVLDTGTLDALVIAPLPAPSAYVAGQRWAIKKAATTNATSASTLNVMGSAGVLLGAKAILRRDGSSIAAGDLARNMVFDVEYDGTSFRLIEVGQAEISHNVVNPIIYVRTDGSDANDGSANDSAHAFLTIGAALARGIAIYSLTNQTLTIQLGNTGTYTVATQVFVQGALNVIIRGDPAAQASYIVSGAGVATSGIIVSGYSANLQLVGLTVTNTSTISNSVAAISGGSLSLTNVTFTVTGGAGLFADIFSDLAGTVTVLAGCIHASSHGYMWYAQGGTIIMAANVTVSGTPAYAVDTVRCWVNGSIQVAPGGGFAFSGTATGTIYSVTLNGVINTNGGGANFFPGSVAGSTATGGQYA